MSWNPPPDRLYPDLAWSVVRTPIHEEWSAVFGGLIISYHSLLGNHCHDFRLADNSVKRPPTGLSPDNELEWFRAQCREHLAELGRLAK